MDGLFCQNGKNMDFHMFPRSAIYCVASGERWTTLILAWAVAREALFKADSNRQTGSIIRSQYWLESEEARCLV